MALPISPDIIHSELQGMEDLAKKWRESVGNGIPNVDFPSTQEALDDYIHQLVGEIFLLSSKASSLASILSEQ